MRRSPHWWLVFVAAGLVLAVFVLAVVKAVSHG